MPYYDTCPDCGATLDPGERCDCQKPVPHLEEIGQHIYKLRNYPKGKNDVATDGTVATPDG